MNQNNDGFFVKYIKSLNTLLSDIDMQCFEKTIALIEKCHKAGGKLIFVGNGGSAAMASHLSVDFTKACKIRSINFNEADLLTCFSNDYGYENWVHEALKAYMDVNDLVILISSSGNSANITNAADYCLNNKVDLITFSGFQPSNSLRSKGNCNFWVNSSDYNFVEMVHHVWLVALVDYFATKRADV